MKNYYYLDKKYLNLLREITTFQFKLKDQSTLFGFMWSFLHPIILLFILFIIFSLRLGEHVEHYKIYLFIGIIQYTYFANGTSSAMRVVASMRQLTTNVIFPKEVLVFGSVISNTIIFLVTMSACIIIAFFSGVNISWSILMLPLILLLELMLVLWVSILLSCFYVFLRDIGDIYQVFLRALFIITPIFYTMTFLGHGTAKSIVLLNPLTHLIDFSRAVIIKGEFISIKLLLFLFLINAAFIFISMKIFKQYEPKFAENL
jgi:lipopolysaccharide transport system permease protein